MPSFNIHLAIANRYIQKHKIENPKEFLEGSIAPDFEENKRKSHYTVYSSKDTIIEHLKNKVSIENFLKENEVKTDYEKGVFLHLLTDKLFFTEFFPIKYLEKTDYKEFVKNLYFSYHETNDYLIEKYNIKFPKKFLDRSEEIIKEKEKSKQIQSGNEQLIIQENDLDKFIEYVSNINIDEYIKNYK